MSYFEITKTYKGGRKVLYIELDEGEPDNDMLESIGDSTDGGQNYGYTMDWKEIEELPENVRILPRKRTVQIY